MIRTNKLHDILNKKYIKKTQVTFMWSHRHLTLSSWFKFYFLPQLKHYRSKVQHADSFSLHGDFPPKKPTAMAVTAVSLFGVLFLWPIFLFATATDHDSLKIDAQNTLLFSTQKEAEEQLAQGFPLMDRENTKFISAKSEYPSGWNLNPNYKEWYDIKVEGGATLQSTLMNRGFSYQDTQEIVTAISPFFSLSDLKEGQKVEILLNKTSTPIGVNLVVNAAKTIQVTKTEQNDFYATPFTDDGITQPIVAAGTINSSFYKDALDAGASENAIYSVIQLLSYSIDFQRDIHPGDEFKIVFLETSNAQGELIDDSDILYIDFYRKDLQKNYEFFGYKKLDGTSSFYDKTGDSVKRTLLKSPVNGAYISSKWGMRTNPVTGYRKTHKGVDFAVGIGTPIYSTGNGVVTVAAYSRVYGNYVKIKHGDHYETLYSHMRNFSSHTWVGAKVNQGQTIGYVGVTGQTTGPHVHYEVWRYGVRINPSTLNFAATEKLYGKDKELFKLKVDSFGNSFL